VRNCYGCYPAGKEKSVSTIIKIGISSCLLGNSVRYDGGHQLDRYLSQTLGQYVEFVPVCPEVECGLGVPREPMRLVGSPESPRLITTRTKIDHTARMQAWVEQRLSALARDDLCGFIFESNSPSSGPYRVRVYTGKGMPVKRGRGLFAGAFADRKEKHQRASARYGVLQERADFR